jgi:hypothetical protein
MSPTFRAAHPHHRVTPAGPAPLQIGFGSGFKCNSAVWRALRPIKEMHNSWAHIQGRESQAMDVILALGQEKVRLAACPCCPCCS